MSVVYAPTIECPAWYWASSEGHIYSHAPTPGVDREMHRLSPAVGAGGRLEVSLRVATGVKKTFFVHRLVCGAFHGPCPEGKECSHLHGDHLDNRPQHLRWETRERNVRRSLEHGTRASVLTKDQVLEILSEYEDRHGQQTELAGRFGVSISTVHLIVRGRSWVHLR